MSKGGGAPQSPDPYTVANAQSGANIDAIRESAKLNSINQYGPSGSSTYQKDANGLPISQTVTLNPANQQFTDTSNAIRNALADKAQSLSGYLPTTPFTGPDSGSGDAVQNALYQRRLGLIQPQLDQAQNETNVTLSDRGIPIGSEIYNNEQNRVAQNRDNAYLSAAQDATLAAGGEQDRQLQNALTIRNQPFNEVSAFLTGAPSMQSPQFQATPQYNMQAPNISGLISQDYANKLGQYNQNSSSLYNGLFGLGSAAIGGLLSDRRVKTDIRKIGNLDNGLPVYSFKYLGRGPTWFGVMADEVKGVVPDAVSEHGPEAIMMVDYGKVADHVEMARAW